MQFARVAVFPDNAANVAGKAIIVNPVYHYLGNCDLPVNRLSASLKVNRSGRQVNAVVIMSSTVSKAP